MKIAFVSLGCAKNLVNTEQMMALVKAAGHTVTGDPEGADVAVLNTCGFIDSAKSEAIQNILELAALKDQGKLGKLLVAGCLTQRYRDEILEELPEIDGILGTGSYTDIVLAVKGALAGRRQAYLGQSAQAALEGDPAALECFEAVADWAGRGLADLAAILDPECFIVGGGVSDAGEMLLDPIRNSFARNVSGGPGRTLADIRVAELGGEAGIVGAGDLARR